MSLTVHQDLRAAFRAGILTVSGIPDQHWEGRQYTPTKGVPYFSESFRPLSSVPMATGTGGTIAHKCTVNFTLHYPAGAGTTGIDAMAAKIMDKFIPGSSLTYGGNSCVVLQCERSPLLQEPDWINCTVIVTLMAHTVRT